MGKPAVLSLSKPFPDQCGWFEAVEREQEWHMNQAAHYMTKIEDDWTSAFWAMGHAVVVFPYHIPLLNCLIYTVTYVFYAIFDPDCMEKALTRAKREGNVEGERLLSERTVYEVVVPPEPKIHRREKIHAKIKQVFNQQFKSNPLLIGPAGVGKTAIAESYPGVGETVILMDHLDEWKEESLRAFFHNHQDRQIIGCCRKKGKASSLLERHFTDVTVTPPKEKTLLKVLKKAFPNGEEAHLQDAIDHARGMQPGSAVTLYDEAPNKGEVPAFAKEKYGVRTFTEEEIGGLEDYLKKRVKGQDEAIQKVLPALRNFARGAGGKRAFHFAGLTGTGKTELAFAIAQWLYGSRDNVLHLNMGKFPDACSLKTLLGADANFVGYEDGGTIQERAKEGPFLLLIDDFHQSNVDCVAPIIQRLCDKGKLFDPLTRRDIDMSHVFVVMTSNFGSQAILEGMEPKAEFYGLRHPDPIDTNDSRLILNLITADEKAFFAKRLEARNRFITVPFLPITDSGIINQVTEKLLGEEKDYFQKHHKIELEWDNAFVQWCTDTFGKSADAGMRPIEDYIQITLRDAICQKSLSENSKIKIGYNGVITLQD